MRHSRLQVLGILLLLQLCAACKKSDSGSPPQRPQPLRPLPPRLPLLRHHLLFQQRRRSGCSRIPETIKATTSNSQTSMPAIPRSSSRPG